MGLGETMIVAGIGCRTAILAEQVESALEAALRHSQIEADQLSVIAVPAVKGGEPGIVEAASARGVLLVLITQHALEEADLRTVTRSVRSIARFNVRSVAEAAALAAAGPHSRLLAPRVAVGPVTCALATGDKLQ
jgi:cobalt-precorrin 5A hydrolase